MKLDITGQELEDIIVALDYYAEDMEYRYREDPEDWDEMDDIPDVIERARRLAGRLLEGIKTK